MSQQNPVKKQTWRCGYCREQVAGSGFWGNGVIYCCGTCRELGIAHRAKTTKTQNPWYIVLAALATLLTMAVSDRVLAQELPPVLQISTLACDTKEQVVSVVQMQQKEGFAAAQALATKLGSACVVGELVVLTIGIVHTERNMTLPNGIVDGLVIEVRSMERPETFFILVFIKATKPTTEA